METIDSQDSSSTQIECPACLAAGVVSASGYAARLVWMPALRPPYRCLAGHGGFSKEDLAAAGVDAALIVPGIDEESRERWEDESPAAVRVRPYMDRGSEGSS
jgi:hypothetical protein